MKGVQCYELFGGIALKNHTFSFSYLSHAALGVWFDDNSYSKFVIHDKKLHAVNKAISCNGSSASGNYGQDNWLLSRMLFRHCCLIVIT